MALKLKNSQTQARPIDIPAVATIDLKEDNRLNQALSEIADLKHWVNSQKSIAKPDVIATIQRDKDGKMKSILITERN
jgi:hypothetical protein